MPELPEVETMVRGIRASLEGGIIQAVSLADCLCRPILLQPGIARIRKIAVGTAVQAVVRRAKRVLIRLENDWTFAIEPRMTGLMLIDSPPDREHLRLQWTVRHGRRKCHVWFWDRRGLGTVRLLNPEQLEVQLGPRTLGPDALEFTPELWRERLQSRRPIKVALLDQKLVAGIGNLYASEILHHAGIHPGRPAARLTRTAIDRLHTATLKVLEEAIRYEGSTLGDGTYRNALNQSGGYQNEHRVYGKQGAICPTCRSGTIRRVVQAQRSTFYCPRCQK